MAFRDELGQRMKEFYEQIPKTKLMRRVPVAIRIDGKAFHTFTKGFQKPFDNILMKSMQETMKYLCENIQGCVMGYTQSDEITLILIDYKKLNSDAWFGYEIQKMCSIASGMATMSFNKFFEKNAQEWLDNYNKTLHTNKKEDRLYERYSKAIEKGAMFDARCFNIPKEEVANLIYWRQLDAQRNSIQMVGQSEYSSRYLNKKSCNDIKQSLREEKNIIWEDMEPQYKRGVSCIKNQSICEPYTNKMKFPDFKDGEWCIDINMPIIKGEDRKYVDELIYV